MPFIPKIPAGWGSKLLGGLDRAAQIGMVGSSLYGVAQGLGWTGNSGQQDAASVAEHTRKQQMANSLPTSTVTGLSKPFASAGATHNYVGPGAQTYMTRSAAVLSDPERAKALAFGIELFCKDAGFDDEDREALLGLLKQAGPVPMGLSRLARGGAAAGPRSGGFKVPGNSASAQALINAATGGGNKAPQRNFDYHKFVQDRINRPLPTSNSARTQNPGSFYAGSSGKSIPVPQNFGAAHDKIEQRLGGSPAVPEAGSPGSVSAFDGAPAAEASSLTPATASAGGAPPNGPPATPQPVAAAAPGGGGGSALGSLAGLGVAGLGAAGLAYGANRLVNAPSKPEEDPAKAQAAGSSDPMDFRSFGKQVNESAQANDTLNARAAVARLGMGSDFNQVMNGMVGPGRYGSQDEAMRHLRPYLDKAREQGFVRPEILEEADRQSQANKEFKARYYNSR